MTDVNLNLIAVIIAIIGSIVIPIYYKENGKIKEAGNDLMDLIIKYAKEGKAFDEKTLYSIVNQVSFSHKMSSKRLMQDLKWYVIMAYQKIETIKDIPLNIKADILMTGMKLPNIEKKDLSYYMFIISLLFTIIAAGFSIYISLNSNPLSLSIGIIVLFSLCVGYIIGWFLAYIKNKSSN